MNLLKSDIVKHANQFKIGVLGLIVSVLAVIFIATQIDRQLFLESITTARYEYLIPTVILLLIGLVTRAIRWQILLSGGLPLGRAFSIMNVAYLVNGVLPLRIGELARMYLASRTEQSVPIPKTASTIIVERLLDLLAVVVMMLLALTVAPVPAELQAAGLTTAVIALIGFIFLVILARRRDFTLKLVSQFVMRISWLRDTSVVDWINQFLDGLAPLTEIAAFSRAIVWTAISWGFSVAAGYVLMFAFFEQGDIATTMLYIAAAAFAIALPAVPGNVGTYEASILLALSAMGYTESSTALAFAVMVHAVNVFVHVSTGIVGFIQEGISLGQLTQGVRQMQQPTEAGSHL